jgi:carbamoyl-phosphate synthase large subunit
LPESGTAFVSVNNDDKANLLPIARDLAELGLPPDRDRGHGGVPARLRARGRRHLQGERRAAEHRRRDRQPQGGSVVNTPLGRESFFDDRIVRRAAMMHQVPCVTTLTGAAATVSAIRALRTQGLEVRALQDYYAGIPIQNV